MSRAIIILLLLYIGINLHSQNVKWIKKDCTKPYARWIQTDTLKKYILNGEYFYRERIKKDTVILERKDSTGNWVESQRRITYYPKKYIYAHTDTVIAVKGVKISLEKGKVYYLRK